MSDRRNSALWGVGAPSSVSELDRRSREIFRLVVDAYFATGVPVGSRTVSRRLETGLSPSTLRNVMADLEEIGLLYAPHTSAGRLPTEAGLRLFVDGLLEIGGLSQDERTGLDAQCVASGRSLSRVLEEATSALSCQGLAGFLSKPCSIKDALAVVRKALAVAAQAAAEAPGPVPD